MKQRVLITGSAGYIGCVMVETLQVRGHQVVGLDTGLYSDTLEGQTETPCAMHIRDIRDVSVDDLEGFHAVVHLAGFSNDALGKLYPRWTNEVNFEASVALATRAREAGVKRFLHASTCHVYGAADGSLVSETAAVAPLSLYADTKARTEDRISELARDDFSPVFLRSATVYGASPRMRLDISVNSLVAQAATSGRIRVFGDGSRWQPLIHVRDLCTAFALLLEAPREQVHNQTFNVGRHDGNHRVGEIAQRLPYIVPGSTVEHFVERRRNVPSLRLVCTKFHAAFPGFAPEWDLYRGIEELLGAYWSANLTAADVTKGRFTRAGQLKELMVGGMLDRSLRWDLQEALAA